MGLGPPKLYTRRRERKRMNILQFGLTLTLSLLLGGGALANESEKELAPTGKLRAGLVFAPSLSLFFNVRQAEVS